MSIPMDPVSEFLTSHHGYSNQTDEWDICTHQSTHDETQGPHESHEELHEDLQARYIDDIAELIIPEYLDESQDLKDEDPTESGISIWDLIGYHHNAQVAPPSDTRLDSVQVDDLLESVAGDEDSRHAQAVDPAPYNLYIDHPGDLDAMFYCPNPDEVTDSYRGFDPSVDSSVDGNDSDSDSEVPPPQAFRFQPTTTQESFKYSLNHKRKPNPMLRANGSPTRNSYTNNLATFNANSVIYNRGRSISKMSLLELYEVMGLAHDHNTAIEREEHIMCILEKHGFCVGEKTWIRDTEEHSRRVILDAVYNETIEKFGYSKRVLEAIIRRGTYARMQSNLRRRRRRRKKACRS